MRVRRRADVRTARMITVGGNGRRQSASHDLRVVELGVPGIRTGNENTAHGVGGSMPESPFAHLEVTGPGAEGTGGWP